MKSTLHDKLMPGDCIVNITVLCHRSNVDEVFERASRVADEHFGDLEGEVTQDAVWSVDELRERWGIA